MPALLADEAVGDEADDFYSEYAPARFQYPWKMLTGAVVVTALVWVTVAACLSDTRSPIVSRGVPKWTTVELNGANNHCHTAVPGESCHVDVKWAMTTGIINHPEWYAVSCSWLKPTDSFEEFQACVYRINQTSCPLPCNPKGSVRQKVVPKSTHKSKPPQAAIHRSDPCHIAKKGEACYEAVVKVLMIESERAKYPKLTTKSSFEEIQAVLHTSPTGGNCARPCSCHTVSKGEKCYQHVQWAMKEGIKLRPSWYIGLTENSTLEDVQAYLHKDARGTCPLPCSGVTAKSVQGTSIDPTANDGAEASEDFHCHTSVMGEKCYDKVMFAMRTGVYEHPDWYPHLSALSSFEEFQSVLYKNHPEFECPRPCLCATAKNGDKCYKNVKWVLHEGIPRHPAWYPDLTETSRWETVQQRLHEDENTTCHTPCTPRVWGKPSLFCFAVFRSAGYELDLVKSQVKKGVGIFACDEFAVLSDKVLKVTDTINTLIIPPCEKVGVSKDGTAANTLVFMQAWTVIWKDTRYKAHDWVIKADPDAVLIIDRLRSHLMPHTGQNVFIKNCMKYTGPGWPMMFGSLEAFSHDAIETYFKGAERCQDELEWEAWGEDLFMGNCLSMLGSKSKFDGGIIGDNVCKGANCADGTTAVYHPFKSAEAWFKCYHEAQSTVFK